jgi:hypothetical protein
MLGKHSATERQPQPRLCEFNHEFLTAEKLFKLQSEKKRQESCEGQKDVNYYGWI